MPTVTNGISVPEQCEHLYTILCNPFFIGLDFDLCQYERPLMAKLTFLNNNYRSKCFFNENYKILMTKYHSKCNFVIKTVFWTVIVTCVIKIWNFVIKNSLLSGICCWKSSFCHWKQYFWRQKLFDILFLTTKCIFNDKRPFPFHK